MYIALPKYIDFVSPQTNKPMTNATIAKAKKKAFVPAPTYEPQLRVLSNHQQKTVRLITKDWQKFTGGVFTDMFDKI